MTLLKPIRLLVLLGLGSLFFVSVASAWTPFDDGSVEPRDTMLSAAENDFLNDLNAYRAANHLVTMKPLPVVQACTTWMSDDMQKRWSAHGGLSHIDSMSRDFGPRLKACGYDQNAYKGEILAAGFTNGHDVFKAWKASSTHNPIMLGTYYRYVGVSMTNGLWDVDFVSLYDNTYAQ